MKWVSAYFFGYFILVTGILLALWKSGVIEQVGLGWTAIGVVIALGIGVMIAVENSGKKETIQIEK